MDNWLEYFLKVAAFQGLFFAFFWFFLQRETHHQLNRVVLLTVLIASILVPFVKLPTVFEQAAQQVGSISYEGFIIEPFESLETNAISAEANFVGDAKSILSLVYLVVTSLVCLRFVVHLFLLLRLKATSKLVSRSHFRLYETALVYPFSFLKNIFLPKPLFNREEYDQILTHESEHVRCYHSIDRLIVDFMVALLWFNPVIYLYRKALIEIHEYQADQAVLNQYPDRIAYQEVLYSQLTAAPQGGLMSHFNFSITKKRIVMINKEKSTKYWIYLTLAPVVLLMILAFAGKKNASTITNRDSLLTPEVLRKDQPTTMLKPSIQEPDYRPSILPVVGLDNVKVTSSFGKRKDPFTGEMKMHKGMDVRVPIGTKIVATAEGVVKEAQFHKGYGNYVLIDHGGEYMTKYGQLDSHTVEKGEKVKKGQQIGFSGNSGRSTGPHLHYEVVVVGKGHVDPIDYIQNYDFSKVKTGQQIDSESKNTSVAKLNDAPVQSKVEKQLSEKEKDKRIAKVNKALVKQKEKMKTKVPKQKLKISDLLSYSKFYIDGYQVSKNDNQEIDFDQVETVDVYKGVYASQKYGEDANEGLVVLKMK